MESKRIETEKCPGCEEVAPMTAELGESNLVRRMRANRPPRWIGGSRLMAAQEKDQMAAPKKEVPAFTAEELDRLFPQAVGWLAKVEIVKRSLTPAKAKQLQDRIDEGVAEKLAS